MLMTCTVLDRVAELNSNPPPRLSLIGCCSVYVIATQRDIWKARYSARVADSFGPTASSRWSHLTTHAQRADDCLTHIWGRRAKRHRGAFSCILFINCIKNIIKLNLSYWLYKKKKDGFGKMLLGVCAHHQHCSRSKTLLWVIIRLLW